MDGFRLVAAGGIGRHRLAAPAAVLLAATLAVGLVRGELRGDGGSGSAPEPATAVANPAKPVAAEKAKRTTRPAPATARFHTVEAGDTLSSIAAANGLTLERLRALNPALEPTALFIGMQVRLR